MGDFAEGRKCLFAAPTQMIVATDLTDTDALVPHAVAQAKASGAHVTLVHAIPPSDIVPLAAATLRIEGRIAGPWALELERSWHDLWASTKKKNFQLDLCGVTFVDRKGAQILQEIVRTTGAEILADSPLTQHFASQARSDWTREPSEES